MKPTDYTAALARMARRPHVGKPITYQGGQGGLGNPATSFIDCPQCGFAVRVDFHGDNLTAGCDEADVLARWTGSASPPIETTTC